MNPACAGLTDVFYVDSERPSKMTAGSNMQGIEPSLENSSLVLVGSEPVTGYLHGFKQPILVAKLRLPPREITAADLQSIDRVFLRALPDYGPSPSAIDAANLETDAVPGRLITVTTLILKSAGVPVFQEGAVVSRRHGAPTEMLLALPALHGHHTGTLAALNWALKAANAGMNRDENLGALAVAALPRILDQLRLAAPYGMNPLQFLQAAHDTDIPWRRVYGKVYQFGQGARARWLDSSFTDATSTIGGNLARSKRATAALLRTAGVPVPDHARAENAEQAVAIAESLGYPVVVKPGDLDGGAGVSVGIRGAAGVRNAFAKAQALSKEILVEKHFEGNDYRLQVFQGEVFWVSHRVPGGVTGDGKQSVVELLNELNADPRRGEPGTSTLLRRIELDAEALELLAEQDLSPDAVPAAGRPVRLRRAANVASGGTFAPVMDQAHPDNLALGARAASLLRLDIAGVDLLIPDIRRSWLESGAAICEVNAQPQLSPTLPPYLLKRLLPTGGRIPVVVVFGHISSADRAAWFEPLLSMMARDHAGKKRCLGVATPTGVLIDQQIVMPGPCGVYKGGMALVADPRVEMMMLHISDYGWGRTGLPVDRFDALVLTGSTPDSKKPHNADRWSVLERRLQGLCTGPVFRPQTSASPGADLTALLRSLESVSAEPSP